MIGPSDDRNPWAGLGIEKKIVMLQNENDWHASDDFSVRERAPVIFSKNKLFLPPKRPASSPLL